MQFVTEKEFLEIQKNSDVTQNQTYLYWSDGLFHAIYQEENQFRKMVFPSMAEAFVYLDEAERLSEADLKTGVKLKAQTEFENFIQKSQENPDPINQAKEIYIKKRLYQTVTSPEFLNQVDFWFLITLLNPDAQILEDSYRMTFKEFDLDITEESLADAILVVDELYL